MHGDMCCGKPRKLKDQTVLKRGLLALFAAGKFNAGRSLDLISNDETR